MLKNSFRIISSKYILLCKKTGGETVFSEAENWLLDNFYIIEKCFKETGKALAGIKRGAVRKKVLISLSKKLLDLSGGSITESGIYSYLSETQNEEMLSADEIWLFPAYLKAAVINKIAALCEGETGGDDNMGHLIKSLIAANETELSDKFEKLCLTDRVFAEKTEGFTCLSDETKAQYRKAVSDISRKSGKSETAIAEAAASLAQNGKNIRDAHVGYYLIDGGRKELLKAMGLRAKRDAASFLYPACIASITVFILMCLFAATKSPAVSLAALLPAMEAANALCDFIFTKAVKPKALPRLKLSEGVPEDGKTMIVYPVLLSSPEAVCEVCDKLEVCRAANREENLFFALLGDLKDGDSETFPDDEKITGEATERILRLNEEYGDVFYLFIRGREYIKAQGKWMGKERKRGALSALCSFLKGGGADFSVFLGDKQKLCGMKYIITLDSDTVLPIGGAEKLIGAAMHPLNRPVLDEKKNIVTEGYGIIKPKISIDTESASKTVFSRVFAGAGGVDSYSSALSDIYMDIFGEAIFTGKGIFDIDAFLKCTKKAIPDNTVLSHDLLEGSYLRCALCSAAEVYDSYPSSFQSFAKRQHRWIRGDWQLLPWLLKKVLLSDGKKAENPLSKLSKWKIFDNLRRSLSPAVLFLLLAFPYLIDKENMLIITLAAAGVLTLPLLMYAASGIFSGGFKAGGEKRYADIIVGLRACFYQTVLNISFLPFFAYLSADAVIRTLARILFTRKNTLQWVTASDAEHGKAKSVRDCYKYMAPCVCLSAAAVITAFFAQREYLGPALVLGVIWAASPAVAFFISREEKKESAYLSKRSREFLAETAKRTWNFFAEYTTAQENFLPPDNIQLRPFKGAAHRTSPTNIGLYMLSVLGARDLEFIDTDEMEKRLSKTLDTLEKLEKWRGHLLNWYDTRSLKPLYPRYVSTVDSGNFICYLMTVSSGVSEYGGEGCENITKRLKKIINEASFLPLFDKNKKLFYIGYNIEENSFSPSYYDMLASEARQTVFLSVARGEVKPSAWFALSRTLTTADGYKGLASWTGTMFEYFMPPLIMRTYKNTLLDESRKFALSCQKKYGKKRRIPWGVSESGFFSFDSAMNYGYKAFGVPALGLKRGLSCDSVTAPYASLLALGHDTRAAVFNLWRLRRMGAFGEYGFFEAVDFTAARVPAGEKYAIVKSYMAHHQGMALASLVNLFCGNTMQKRFEKWPCVRAALPLLQEKVPVGVSVKNRRHEKIYPVRPQKTGGGRCVREYEGEYILPPMHALSNGIYKVLIDNRGCGISSCGDVNLNRKRPSPDDKERGIMFFIKTEDGSVLSAYDGKCVFSPHMAEFHTKHGGIESNLSLCVLPEESAEERRITLVNKSGKMQKVDILAYCDISLMTHEAEISHSAFAGMFVKTSFEDNTLFAERQPRSENDRPCVGFMAAQAEGDICGDIQFDTDRAALLRERCAESPLKAGFPPVMKSSVGHVLDPCFAIQMRFEIKNGESASADFLLGITGQMGDAKKAVCRFKEKAGGTANFEEAYKNEELRPVKLFEGEEEACLNALPHLYFRGAPAPEIKKSMRENTLPLRELWKYGISGNYPIVTAELFEMENIKLLERVLRAHAFWRYKGIKTDLVILCSETASYNSPVSDKAREEAKGCGDGVYILSSGETDERDRNLLIAASSLYFDGKSTFESAVPPLKKKDKKEEKLSLRKDKKLDIKLLFKNSFGGFSEDGKEYIIHQKSGGDTPAPWCNVMANERIGTLVSESGGGFTWYKNSREMRLTEWRNDAASDILQEKLIIEDESGVWSPQAGALHSEGEFITVHGIGYTEYKRYGDTDCEMKVFVPPSDTVKIITVKMRNNTEKETSIKAVYSVSPVIGAGKYETRARLSAHVTESGVICKNVFGEAPFVFLFTQGENGIKNADSGEKLKESCGEPVLLYAEKSLKLQGGEEKEICFLFGAAESEEEAAEMVLKYKENKAAFDEMKKWREGISALKTESGQKQIDFLFNNWLLYQVTSCRLWGRSAFYQSGGAFGFRDQLQDTLALLLSSPDLTKKQILKAAAHQFPEGDVLHWWHEGKSEKGVRTRISDDRLFLPYVTAEYIEKTGDFDILNEKIPFLEGPELSENQKDLYFETENKLEEETLYIHCRRAIDVSLKFGSHGLPLMGGGDWNDGMNEVGIGGRGESVWLSWFLRDTLLKFAPLCKRYGDSKTAVFYEKCAADLKVNTNNSAWDGEWFIRAFYDDGTPLGSAQNAVCKIDSISQSWAVISQGTDKERAKRATDSAAKLLIDDTNGIVKLLSPPFTREGKNPGYIAAYPEGVRENGGQYTHAAVWLSIAAAIMGDGDTAWKISEYINPVNHTKTDISANKYKTEGYVLAADIYSAAGYEGRGGWTWYTGAAAWYYVLLSEYIFGFKKRGDTVEISPCLPSFMKSFKMTYKFFDTEYRFDVSRGEENKNTKIKLVNDKKVHEIKVTYKVKE